MSPFIEEIWKQCYRHRQNGLEPHSLYVSHDRLREFLGSKDCAPYEFEYKDRNTIFGLKVFTVDRINDHLYVAGEIRRC